MGLTLVVPLGLAGLALIGSAAPARRRFDPAIILLQIAVIGVIVLGVVEQVDGPYFFYPPEVSIPVSAATRPSSRRSVSPGPQPRSRKRSSRGSPTRRSLSSSRARVLARVKKAWSVPLHPIDRSTASP